MRTVVVAIVDSGINAAHPHVGGTVRHTCEAPGGGWSETRSTTSEGSDQIGHGTACAALVREAASDATLLSLKLFDRELRAPCARLSSALEYLAEQEVDLINLSVGIGVDAEHAMADDLELERLAAACARLGTRGVPVVAAIRHPDSWGLPAALAGSFAVAADSRLAPGQLGIVQVRGRRLHLACPFPRPMPGQPISRNFAGSSFAAARVTAHLAGLLQGADARSATALAECEERLDRDAVSGARHPSLDAWLGRAASQGGS